MQKLNRNIKCLSYCFALFIVFFTSSKWFKTDWIISDKILIKIMNEENSRHLRVVKLKALVFTV